MVYAEAFTAINTLCCGASLLLGGRLAGLNAPGGKRLLLWSAVGGAAAWLPLIAGWLALPALTLLPVSVAGCYRGAGRAACLRATLTTACAAMLLGGAGTLFAGAGARCAVWLAAGVCLLLCPLLRLLPGADVEIRQIELRRGDAVVQIPAMLDSGNLLRDPLTNTPVIVVGSRAVRPLIGEPSVERLPPGFRLLRVKTAAGDALLPMFRPDVCRVYVNGKPTDTRALVAVAPREYDGVQALVPTSALPGVAAIRAPRACEGG